jgi:hypothetical protein
MKGLGLLFFATGAACGIAGMVFGVWMGIAQDFTLAPAHAHLNLVGFVTLSLMGVYYHLTPAAAETRLAQAQYLISVCGVAGMVPGIALAVQGQGEGLAILGSVLTVAGMATFIAVILRTWAAGRRPQAQHMSWGQRRPA